MPFSDYTRTDFAVMEEPRGLAPHKRVGRIPKPRLVGRGESNPDYVIRVGQKSVRPIASQKEDSVAEIFGNLLNTWKRETEFESALDKLILHPAYQRIIGMGKPALPALLREMRDHPVPWHWAMFAITGEDPTAPEDAGRFDVIAAKWLAWGRTHGIAV
jgi:hypothetical protein